MTSDADVQEFRHHPLWDELAGAQKELAAARGRTPTDRHTLTRAAETLAYAARFKSVPVRLLPSNRSYVATQMQGAAQTIRNQVGGWDQRAAMTSGTIQNIDSNCDAVLQLLKDGAWPPLQRDSRAQAVVELAEAYEDAAERSLLGLQERVQESRSVLTEAEKEFRALVKRSEARGAESEQLKQELEEAIDGFEARAAESLRDTLAAAQDDAKKARAAEQERSEAHLASLDADAERGRRLIQIVGDQSNAEGYLNYANNQSSRAFWSDVIGVIIAVAAVAYLAWEYRSLTSLTVQATVVRAAIALPALALSGYFFRQASRGRTQSTEARYRALDLLALKPFTLDMNDADQQRLRVMLGERLFSGPNAEKARVNDKPASRSAAPTTTDDVRALIQVLQSFIR